MANHTAQLDKLGLKCTSLSNVRRKQAKLQRTRKLRRLDIDEQPMYNKYHGYAT